MIQITRKEADFLRGHRRDKYIHVTSKTHKSSAKKYYVVTNDKNLELLKEFRNSINLSE